MAGVLSVATNLFKSCPSRAKGTGGVLAAGGGTSAMDWCSRKFYAKRAFLVASCRRCKCPDNCKRSTTCSRRPSITQIIPCATLGACRQCYFRRGLPATLQASWRIRHGVNGSLMHQTANERGFGRKSGVQNNIKPESQAGLSIEFEHFSHNLPGCLLNCFIRGTGIG